MSFNTMKLAELKGVAENFGVELPTKTSKAEVLSLLEEEGVSYQDYERFANVEKVEPEPQLGRKPVTEVAEDTMLIRMDRENYSYQVEGFTFTKEHPFAAVPLTVADYICRTHAGFRPALPSEAQAFYS